MGGGGVPRRRWGIATLLALGILISYFDRVNLSVSRDALRDAFGISDLTFGILLSAYNWTYMVLQLPSGLLLDRFGVRRIGIISTAIWSVASFFAAISNGIGALFAARFLLGIGEAPRSCPTSAEAQRRQVIGFRNLSEVLLPPCSIPWRNCLRESECQRLD